MLALLVALFAVSVMPASVSTTPRLDFSPERMEIMLTIMGTWPIEQWVEVAKRAKCESRLRPSAVGQAGELGLLQIHPVHWRRVRQMGYAWVDMSHIGPNLEVARVLWDEQGWGPWSCGGGS